MGRRIECQSDVITRDPVILALQLATSQVWFTGTTALDGLALKMQCIIVGSMSADRA
jgi:hypothetical protein